MEKPYRRNRSGADMLTVRTEAQKIAFAPVIFQAVKAMLDFDVLKCIKERGFASVDEIARHSELSKYAAGVLLDIAVYSDLLKREGELYSITYVGLCMLEDETTLVNFHFINDVCYQGAFYLGESLKSGTAEGLKVFGGWETIYAGLCELPENVQKSWFDFDNYYSDISFAEAISIVLRSKPDMVYDIGANSGKFGKMLLSMDENVRLTCFDLPKQLEIAKTNISNGRAAYIPVDILIDDIPSGADAVWMSQFLDCFSPERIIHILKKAKLALNEEGRIFILEPFIDNQRSKAAALSLAGTSLYFTCMANGYSKMYHQYEFEELISAAGLYIKEAHQGIGDYDYTLLECKSGKTMA